MCTASFSKDGWYKTSSEVEVERGETGRDEGGEVARKRRV
jgi:hypothetical protein